MQEKEMISDYLAGINASLAGYGGIISQCENQELRETIQNMRNQDEICSFQNCKRKRILYSSSTGNSRRSSYCKTTSFSRIKLSN